MLPTTASSIDLNALVEGGGVLASGVRECVREHGAGNRAGRWRCVGSRAGMVSIYHGMQCVMETTDGIGPVRTYAWGLDVAGRVDMADSPFVSMAGAGGVGGLLAASDLSESYCYAYDGNGNVMALVDAAGDVAGEYRYGPYGQTRTAAETGIANPFRFSTKFLETAFASENETLSFGGVLDLYDYGFRWYHAGLGRWTSRDPIGERNILIGSAVSSVVISQLYSFSLNDPIGLIDVQGLIDLGTADTLKRKGCCYLFTIKVHAMGYRYSSGEALIKSLAKGQSKGEAGVGHSWIRLENVRTGYKVEGGHSGETGDASKNPSITHPEFLTASGGVIYLSQLDAHDPSPMATLPEADPRNPIRWLTYQYEDGHWAPGSGGHTRISRECSWCLSQGEFRMAKDTVSDLRSGVALNFFGLTGKQCTATATDIAVAAGITLDPFVSLAFPPSVTLAGITVRLWSDSMYSGLTFALPDKMAQEIQHAPPTRMKTCKTGR